MKITEFIVEGTGDLPADMLRYDACWPADQEAAQSIYRNKWSADDKWYT